MGETRNLLQEINCARTSLFKKTEKQKDIKNEENRNEHRDWEKGRKRPKKRNEKEGEEDGSRKERNGKGNKIRLINKRQKKDEARSVQEEYI